ncbi:MAG: hypothetical protein MZV64_30135 [Ignavibacteriales bacterium]|nr:hypothetical protein [Ignavibacteriales bacterium]
MPGPDDPGATRPPGELTILRLAAEAPPLFENSVTFWAVRGEDREGRLYFSDGQGQRGEEYVRLKVDAASLLARPDGNPVRGRRLRADHHDGGRPGADPLPVRAGGPDVQQRLARRARDRVPGGRRATSTTTATWTTMTRTSRRASASGARPPSARPSCVLGSAVIEDLEEIEAELTSFSRYAIAY